MSKILINQYYQNVERAVQFGKSYNEQSIRTPFFNLLNEYARKLNYEMVPEVSEMGTRGAKVRPDGVLKNLWGLTIGLWESKDSKDDFEEEINKKVKTGYPLTNILFEDSNLAVLYQRGEEVGRAKVKEPDDLHKLLSDFVNFKSESVYKFEDAIEKFKADIPKIVDKLRDKIGESRENNKAFLAEQERFLELCKAEINPAITLEDIREMMIQHILTSDIFNKIFDDSEFHKHNTIAAALETLIGFLFTYAERRNLLESISHYYEAINATAASITDHHTKQKFLKVLYENFYKVYNPKAADRLGVVYTPNEIVQFMVQSTDYLLHKHFGKTMADKNVEILDPATGTATFISEIIENVIPKHVLDYKYKNEIHANEVAILPYYIANLNIEYTFKQKMGYYAEFPNLCFVDTLDNTDALTWKVHKSIGHQTGMFALTSENTERIRRQNSKKISVVIGNPPYNANQMNWNDFNKNREYPIIDKRIKETYILNSNAQKTKAYDMYSRFIRWATDRIKEDGIIALVTNNSFINKPSFDGFRDIVGKEFSEIYIIDLVGDLREDKEGNVFDIKVGVAITFFIKNASYSGEARIWYYRPSEKTKNAKLDFLKSTSLANIPFQHIIPKAKQWINLAKEDASDLLPIFSSVGNSLFYQQANGVSTNRDEWVYDFNNTSLLNKVKYTVNKFNESVKANELKIGVKWSSTLSAKFDSKKLIKIDNQKIANSLYRPFTRLLLFAEKDLCDRLTAHHFDFYGSDLKISNCTILISSGQRANFSCLSSDCLPNLDVFLPNGTKCLPINTYDKEGNRKENITDWGLMQFQNHYADESISKESIFHYTYAVLHNPAYRKKYELNLKREFPRLPFYADFYKWAQWGKELMELHIGYEQKMLYPLQIVTAPDPQSKKGKQESMFAEAKEPEPMFAYKTKIKPKLKADKTAGTIEIDELTSLHGIPPEAWEYKLGNRSALEWILDQYKEKKPSDPTIAEKFNTYRFADYKEHVIELLQKVCTVSVETMRIIKEMEIVNYESR